MANATPPKSARAALKIARAQRDAGLEEESCDTLQAFKRAGTTRRSRKARFFALVHLGVGLSDKGWFDHSERGRFATSRDEAARNS